MYPHGQDFLDKVSEYIDFSSNEELWEEATQMSGLGECVYRDGLEEGLEKGREEGRAEGREEGIQALILDNLEERIPMEKILGKLQKRFDLTEDKAEEYYKKFAQEETPV